jgi:hypothetical protein
MERRAHVVLNNSRTPRRAAVALAVVGLTLALVAPAQAVERTGKHAPKILTPTATALTIAQAIASSSVTVTGASFVTKPPNSQPNGVGDASPALGGFPVDGGTYGILTTGNIASVDKPGTFASTDDGGAKVRGDTDLDVSILKIDLTIPQAVNCLSFNFKFLSEEYPTFVGTSFNDAFVAELDTSDWTTSGSTITAPHNFAFDSTGHVVSINSTGLGGMSAANGAGTAFDGSGSDSKGGATVLLGAATPITSGAHSLYLSIFDQGDHVYDSAVFLDNLRVGSVPKPADCKVGATQPAHLTLAKTVVNTGGGTAAATDWTLSATGPTTVSGATGSAAVTNAVVNPGTYTLGEGGPANYSAGAWSCTGGSLTGSSLVLAAGDNANCSITNTFVPPSAVPTSEPSVMPSTAPSTVPSTAPSAVPSSTPSPEPTAAHTPRPTHSPVVTLPPTSTAGDRSSSDGSSGLWLAAILAIASVAGFALAPRPRHRRS